MAGKYAPSYLSAAQVPGFQVTTGRVAEGVQSCIRARLCRTTFLARAHAIKREVNHRGGVEGKHLRNDQPARRRTGLSSVGTMVAAPPAEHQHRQPAMTKRLRFDIFFHQAMPPGHTSPCLVTGKTSSRLRKSFAFLK